MIDPEVVEFRALITGAIQGALMRVADPAGPFLIEVEPVMDEEGYTNKVRVRGLESGVRLLVHVDHDPEDEPEPEDERHGELAAMDEAEERAQA